MPEIRISGVPVSFPFTPYECQKDYMAKVIQSLQKKQNALLESPTGSGKTLCLLCASSAWLKTHQVQSLDSADEIQPKAGATEHVPPGVGHKRTRIIYASRTHAQLSQAIGELKQTPYSRFRTAIIASRDQLCIHPTVSKETSNQAMQNACKVLVQRRQCNFYSNVEKKKDLVAVNNPNDPLSNILDIEDLTELGSKHKCCPYYVTREVAKHSADIIFMPYNYLIDPSIRKSHGIDLDGAILIFDEAHNLAEAAEEMLSAELTAMDITSALQELDAVLKLLDSIELLKSDILKVKAILLDLEKELNAIELKKEFKSGGEFLFDLLHKAKLDFVTYLPIYQIAERSAGCLTSGGYSGVHRKAYGLGRFLHFLKVVYESDSYNKSQSAEMRKAYVSPFYQVYIHDREQQTTTHWNTTNTTNGTVRVLSFWCFSAGLAMTDLQKQGVRCILLTSGTLKPLTSFSSELLIPFPVTLENPHVISPSQVSVSIVKQGPENVVLDSSYQNRNNPRYHTSLGYAIMQIAKAVPNGMLVFFPSYSAMRTIIESWEKGHIMECIQRYKQIFVESTNKEDFNLAMKQYYAMVNDATSNGAIFCGVCRGKMSEGLDFVDKNGRAVVITGIPYAPAKDPKVIMKKSYLDQQLRKCGQTQTLSGMQWYSQQALRAVNQAIGRVVRHRFDYGAILLLDTRFSRCQTTNELPEWIKANRVVHETFPSVIKLLNKFFTTVPVEVEGRRAQAEATNPLKSSGMPPVSLEDDSTISNKLGLSGQTETPQEDSNSKIIVQPAMKKVKAEMRSKKLTPERNRHVKADLQETIRSGDKAAFERLPNTPAPQTSHPPPPTSAQCVLVDSSIPALYIRSPPTQPEISISTADSAIIPSPKVQVAVDLSVIPMKPILVKRNNSILITRDGPPLKYEMKFVPGTSRKRRKRSTQKQRKGKSPKSNNTFTSKSSAKIDEQIYIAADNNGPDQIGSISHEQTTIIVPSSSTSTTICEEEDPVQAFCFGVIGRIVRLTTSLLVMPKAVRGESYVAIVCVGEQLVCSCDHQQMNLALTLCEKNLHLPPEVEGHCVHLEVTGQLGITLNHWGNTAGDEHSYSSYTIHPSTFYVISRSAVLVCLEARFQTVFWRARNLSCDCYSSSHRIRCKFIFALSEKLKSVTEEDEDLYMFNENSQLSDKSEHLWERTSISTAKVPFCSISCASEIPNDLMPLLCTACGSMPGEMLSAEVSVYDLISSKKVKLYNGLCSCGSHLTYDGGSDELLNMGSYLLTHRLLNDYLHNFLLDGITMFSFHRSWSWRLLSHSQPTLPYDHFRVGWLAYTMLLHVPDIYFECPTCQQRPQVIICDGISLSYPRKFMSMPSGSAGGKMLDGSSHTKRIFPLQSSVRKGLLEELSKDQVNYTTCISLAKDSSLYGIFSAAMANESLPIYWRNLIADLLKTSPVTMFLDESCYTEVESLKHSTPDGKVLHNLQIHSPIFYKFAIKMTAADCKLVSPIIDSLLQPFHYLMSFSQHDIGESLNSNDLNSNDLVVTPRLENVCDRGMYSMDDQGKFESKSCRKSFSRHSSLSPGVFTFFCEHGICYGYQVLDKMESPNAPFTFLRTRFKEAPRTVIYDNACHLHSYALNRDPGFFRSTKFLVDRFHWKNHIGCCSSYNISAYSSLQKINTQVAEQSNSLLNRLKSMLSYMRKDNFQKHLSMFLAYRNMLKRLQIVEPVSEQEKAVVALNKLCKR